MRPPHGLILPNLALRLEPVLNRVAVPPTLPLIEFTSAPGDLPCHSTGILPNRGAATGSKTRYASSFTRSLTRNQTSA